MSSSASRGSERMVQQDFIARIRFQNTLPPPPIPPKLLDVPSTGLASGQYTNPAFASRLAREQPLNIEADAELGMPLDLVGMPGIFDGDESSIQAPAQRPPIDPADRALLKPLSTLGKPKVGENSVSFLRRTEYIASSKKRAEADARRIGKAPKLNNKRKSPEPEANTPAYIKRKIEKSFEAAALAMTPAKRATALPPFKKKDAKLVEFLPILPDLDAFPDSGTYVTVKFQHGPLPSNTDSGSANSKYDTRLLSSVFRPIDKTPAEEAAFNNAMEAHRADPGHVPAPANGINYDLYIADTVRTAENFRTKFYLENPDRDDEDLYTNHGRDGRCFRFNRVRGYETHEEKEYTHATKYSEEILMSCGEGGIAGEGDGDAGKRMNAAWVYPIMQRTVIRNQRTKSMARMHSQVSEADDQQVDALDVTLMDPSQETRQRMAAIRVNPTTFDEEIGQEQEEAPMQQSQEESRARADASERDGSSPAHSEDADGDAEGEAVQADDMDEDAEGDEED